MEQIVDFPVSRGGHQDFQPVRVPQRLLRFLLDTLVKGFFALFPRGKKSAEVAGQACQLMDAGGL